MTTEYRNPDEGTDGSGGKADRSYASLLSEKIDSIVLIAVFLVLLSQALSYGESGLFPAVFLVAGIVALMIDVLVAFIPGNFQQTSQVIGASMDQLNDAAEQTSDDEATMQNDLSFTRVGIVIVMLSVYFVVSYTVNFLVATPIFVGTTGYLLDVDTRQLAVLTVLLTGVVYFLFGYLMNTAII